MTDATVLNCAEPTRQMTFAGGLEYIARARRQLARFSDLSGNEGRSIDPREAAEIRRLCDELEAEINTSLSPFGAPANQP